MDQITIPIRDGLSKEHKAALTDWLTNLAQEVLAEADASRALGKAIKRVSDRHGLQALR